MMKLRLAAVLAPVILSGCALSPQIITLDSAVPANISGHGDRTALVRVRDVREDTRYLGYRGGPDPKASPLVPEPDLSQVLTKKTRKTMEQLGFGGNNGAEPLKVEVVVDQFKYGCNDGWWVSACSLDMAFTLNIADGGNTYTKSYSLDKERSVVTAPRTGFNKQWIDETLNQLWLHMFSDDETRQALGLFPAGI